MAADRHLARPAVEGDAEPARRFQRLQVVVLDQK
jgi:hypothetical protein